MKRLNCGPAEVGGVEPGSPADVAGIKAGDLLMKIGGLPLRDAIDVYVGIAGPGAVEVELEREGVAETVVLEACGSETGIELVSPVFGEVATCDNNCMFCFVDQLPDGLRKTLYVKDDDYRLSFLGGNFITLTNLSRADVRRIVNERLSPLYVSLHSTEIVVRKKMFGNPEAVRSLKILRELLKAGIGVHVQIVLVRGVNDGEHLDRTLSDLARQYSEVLSVGIVPVGVSSGGRRTLDSKYAFDMASSRGVIEQVERWRESDPKIRPCAADEFFHMAGRLPPKREYYGSFEQLENGIGLARRFQDEYMDEVERTRPAAGSGVALVTTAAGAWALRPLGLEELGVDIVECDNGLFGHRVNVCGLLPGASVLDALAGRKIGSCVFLPSVALDDRLAFIDGMTLMELADRTGFDIEPIACDGASLVKALGHNCDREGER